MPIVTINGGPGGRHGHGTAPSHRQCPRRHDGRGFPGQSRNGPARPLQVRQDQGLPRQRPDRRQLSPAAPEAGRPSASPIPSAASPPPAPTPRASPTSALATSRPSARTGRSSTTSARTSSATSTAGISRRRTRTSSSRRPRSPSSSSSRRRVPLQWRKYVAEGIEEWNKAYEKLGIVGAIVVQQQTDDNEFASVDPEDARYNFIRWIVTGQGFAMGPSRADPRTGQILDADIIFDDSMLRFYFREIDIFGPAPPPPSSVPEVTQFLTENPAFIPMGMTMEQVGRSPPRTRSSCCTTRPVGSAERLSDAAASASSTPRTACNYAAGMRQQLAMAHFAVAAAGKKIPDKFIGEVIREIMAHEVGHTIGLRHNFKASSTGCPRPRSSAAATPPTSPWSPPSWTTTRCVYFAGDDIEKMQALDHPVHRALRLLGDRVRLQARRRARRRREDLWSPRSPPRAPSAKTPTPRMKTRWAWAASTRWSTASTSAKTPSPRPRPASRFPTRCSRTSKSGPSRPASPTTTSATPSSRCSAPRLATPCTSADWWGASTSAATAPATDAKPALQLIEPKKQREALDLLAATVFKDEFFAIEAELFNDLVPSRWWDWDSMPTSRVDFPVHQMIGSMQSSSLLALSSPQVLQRVYDAELKSKATDKFTAAELISRTRGDLGQREPPTERSSRKPADAVEPAAETSAQHVQYLLAIADAAR